MNLQEQEEFEGIKDETQALVSSTSLGMFTFVGFGLDSSELLGLSILFSWREKCHVTLSKNIVFKYFIEREYAFV